MLRDVWEEETYDLGKAFPPGRLESICRMIGGGPGIGVRVGPGGQLVQDSLEPVAFRTLTLSTYRIDDVGGHPEIAHHKHEVLQRMS